MEKDKLYELLNTKSADEIISMVDMENFKQNHAEDLTAILETTDNNHARNTAAMLLSEMRYSNAVQVLLDLILKPDLENCRGSLIYALENLPLSKEDVMQLVPLLYEGNYEVRFQVKELLLKHLNLLDNDDIVSCLPSLQRRILEYEDRLSILEEVKEELINHLI